jgi:hypothetical protein
MHPSATRTYQHAHYLLRNAQPKPSNPIEIPTLRKSSQFHKESTSRHSSPELIFEMSPVNEYSDSPFATHIPLGFTASQSHIYSHPSHVSPTGLTPPAHEPFMYQFPIFSHQHLRSTDGCRQGADTLGSPCSSSRDGFGAFIQRQSHKKDSRAPALRQITVNTDKVTPPRQPLQLTAKRAVTDKITRVKPAAPIQSKTHVHLSRRLRYISPPLSYPLRTSNLESSDELVSSVETLDPGAFDFEKYLMQRIENEKPFRFRGVEPLSAIRA